MAIHPKWHVMVESGGLLMRKEGTYYDGGEAMAVAAQLSYEGVAPTVYVFHSPGQGAHFPGWELVDTWTDGFADSVTTRYLAAQAVPVVVPPESPADDLGEEVGP